MFGKKKGLSEEERKVKAIAEQRMLERKVRFETALPKFKDEYNQLIRKYGIIHGGVLDLTPTGLIPRTVEMDCWEAVQAQEKKRQDGFKALNGKSPVVSAE